jgi:uncharacterized membrane protein
VALKYHSYATFAGRANLALAIAAIYMLYSFREIRQIMVEMKVDCMTLFFSFHPVLIAGMMSR